MEKVNTIGRGDKTRLNVLLHPVYQLGNKVVCQYQSTEDTIEISFYSDDLIPAPGEEGKTFLDKDLIVEDILENLIMCKIEGSRQQLTLPRHDLQILEVEGNLVDF